MSKLLKSHTVGLLEIESQQGKKLTKYVGFVYAYIKRAKIEKLMMGKVATSRKARVTSDIVKPKLYPPSHSKVLSTKKRDDI